MKNGLIALVMVLLVNVTLADTVEMASPTRSNPLVELGVSLGTPAGLNATIGIWGNSDVPLLARATGMYFGDRLRGVQGDVGLIFTPESHFKHYVALSGVTTGGTDFNWNGIGPAYGFNWHGFSAQLGLSFGSGRTDYIFPVSSPQAMIQIGYSILL